jgi:hypothetical protein
MRFVFLALLLAFVGFSFVSANINCAACDSLSSSECNRIMNGYVTSIRSHDSKAYLYSKMFGECSGSANSCFAQHQLAYQQLEQEEQNVLLRTACYEGYIADAQQGKTLADELPPAQQGEQQGQEGGEQNPLPAPMSANLASICPSECTSYKCQSDLRMSFGMASLDKKIASIKFGLPEDVVSGCQQGQTDDECFKQLYAAFVVLDKTAQTQALLDACVNNAFSFLSSMPLDISQPPQDQQQQPIEDEQPIESEESECSVCDSASDKACLASLEELVAALSDKDRLTFEKGFFNDEQSGYCSDLSDKACLSALDSLYDELSDKTKLSQLKSSCSALLSYSPSSSSSGNVGATAVDKMTTTTSFASSASSSSEGLFQHGLAASVFVVLSAVVVAIAYLRLKKRTYQPIE